MKVVNMVQLIRRIGHQTTQTIKIVFGILRYQVIEKLYLKSLKHHLKIMNVNMISWDLKTELKIQRRI